jgi:hypothetical protein
MAVDESGAWTIYGRSARQLRTDSLAGAIQTAESELEKLGKPRDAWNLIKVSFDGTDSPWFGEHPDKMRIVLGDGARRGAVEPKAYRQAKIGAVAHAALEHVDDPAVMAVAFRFIEQYRQREIVSESGERGGCGGRGRPKKQHVALFWRVADLLEKRRRPVTPASVRVLLKGPWQKIAFELGDPLSDIVNVNVRGSVIDVEYTENWRRRGRRQTAFVEIDEDALKKALRRRVAK